VTLILRGCTALSSLPDLSSLPNLKIKNLPFRLWEDGYWRDPTDLDFSGFEGTSLPERLGECQQLQKLNLGGCSGLTSLPERLGECQQLKELNLWRCSGLTSLPDLSSLPDLYVDVEDASEAVKEWKKGGYKRYPPPPSQ
jgi:hypothetical protein